jgi:hypothetical protein
MQKECRKGYLTGMTVKVGKIDQTVCKTETFRLAGALMTVNLGRPRDREGMCFAVGKVK